MKTRFIPAEWNLKRIASLLRTSLIIASTTQFSPKVFTYWERYCKAEWDGRYTLQVQAASNNSALVKYCGRTLYVTISGSNRPIVNVELT